MNLNSCIFPYLERHWKHSLRCPFHVSCCFSVTKLGPTLCKPMDWSTPGFPVLHNFRDLLKFMSSESVMLSDYLILCCPLLLPSIFPSIFFPMSWSFASGGQRIGASASASVLPVNIQGWFPLGLTGFISLLSKGLSRAFSSTITQKHWFFSSQLSLWSSSHIHNDYWKNHSFGCIDLCWQPVCFLVYCLGLS